MNVFEILNGVKKGVYEYIHSLRVIRRSIKRVWTTDSKQTIQTINNANYDKTDSFNNLKLVMTFLYKQHFNKQNQS